MRVLTLRLFKRVLAPLCAIICLTARANAENDKPFVIPEIKVWQGGEGWFTPPEKLTIYYAEPELEAVARTFASDYRLLTRREAVAVAGQSKGAGAITLTLDELPGTWRNNGEKNKDEEAYKINIGKSIRVTAPAPRGIYWATRTLLQMSERHENGSLPCGIIDDRPDYEMRGLVIDCGRKFIPQDYLRSLVKILSYYKMNCLHVVLNNNGFPKYFNNDWQRTYAAFRLESDTYPGLTARDGHYTKKDFRDLQTEAARAFVEIIPEIDVPAHSLAFSRYKPSLGSVDYGPDHLDLANPEVYEFVDGLFKEYLQGPEPVFVGQRVHIGTDEYSNREQEVVELFRAFTDRYIKYVESYGKKACVWGALTHAAGDTPVKADDVTMYAWYNGYANPEDMINRGYKLVSIPDGMVYIVPGAGYYYDYLNIRKLYDDWSPAHIGGVTVEEGHPSLLGGMFAVWNDIVGNGISVKDIHHRLYPALQTMAVKTWNATPTTPFEQFDKQRFTLSEAPGVNLSGRIGPGEQTEPVLRMDSLPANARLPYEEIGYDYSIVFDLQAEEEEPGTALFKSSDAVFYLSDPVKGMMGFSRDGYLNTFDFRPYPGEMLTVMICGDSRSTSLYINGQLRERMDVEKRFLNDCCAESNNYFRTLVFPLRNSGGFKSKITGLKVYNYKIKNDAEAK